MILPSHAEVPASGVIVEVPVRVAVDELRDDDVGFPGLVCRQRLSAVDLGSDLVVADAGDHSADPHLWARGFFGILRRDLPGIEGEYPHGGPAFGGGADLPLHDMHAVGADNRDVLAEVAGMSASEIDQLYADGVVGEMPPEPPRSSPADHETRIDRGELSRVDGDFGGWRAARAEAGR